MRTDLSLYIHIPWCVQKCPYCDFNSHTIRQPVNETKYLERLVQDFDAELKNISGRSLSSIFIGGGTPSTLSSDCFRRLLEAIAARIDINCDFEVTLEANPGTADADNFRGYRQAGINRLSLGFQSLDDQLLQQLGRIHSSTQAQQAFAIARQSGFDNINIDLMFGLPGQTVKQALSDLKGVIELGPEHISWYQLTLEPNTRFYATPPQHMPDAETIDEIQLAGQALMEQQGFRQYEISAWSRDGRQCRHNLNYWLYGDYIGIGAGAHGKLRLADGRFRRNSKRRHPEDYLAGNFLSSEQFLTEKDLIAEYFMNRLRLFRGFTEGEFEQQTFVDRSLIKAGLQEALNKKLLLKQSDKYQPSETGYRFLNTLMELFV
ncbi:MAG: radical SAM family heme chaperone HemW [Gammaproteobacteria bacterium]|nr:radical SAM family heme chaperone HemW [Gammaproteobacteria bacterium]